LPATKGPQEQKREVNLTLHGYNGSQTFTPSIPVTTAQWFCQCLAWSENDCSWQRGSSDVFTAGWTSEVTHTALAGTPLAISRLTVWVGIPQLKESWGTEGHLQQPCCDRQGFCVSERLLKPSAWSAQLLAMRLFTSTSCSAKGDVRIPLRESPRKQQAESSTLSGEGFPPPQDTEPC